MSKLSDRKPSERNYEEAISRLEEIVGQLEEGNLALETSLTLFEEGIGLAKICSAKLDAAEGRLQILLGFNGDEPKIGVFKLNSEED
jgi:exodeoxyribonuclease VII small subunit